MTVFCREEEEAREGGGETGREREGVRTSIQATTMFASYLMSDSGDIEGHSIVSGAMGREGLRDEPSHLWEGAREIPCAYESCLEESKTSHRAMIWQRSDRAKCEQDLRIAGWSSRGHMVVK